jgi:hypothetical protein
VRAVMFAVRLQKEFQSIDLDCAAGVTTGNCYCGVFGSPLRREFCIVGEKAWKNLMLLCNLICHFGFANLH